ncbi:hypothetical protein D3C86_1286280 [compost metagenome]
MVKKLTVIGIIGKTQGVNNAAKPDKKAIKKIDHKLLAGAGAGISSLAISAVFATFGCTASSFLTVSTASPTTFVSSALASVTTGTSSILKVEGTAIENFLLELIQTSLQT